MSDLVEERRIENGQDVLSLAVGLTYQRNPSNELISLSSSS